MAGEATRNLTIRYTAEADQSVIQAADKMAAAALKMEQAWKKAVQGAQSNLKTLAGEGARTAGGVGGAGVGAVAGRGGGGAAANREAEKAAREAVRIEDQKWKAINQQDAKQFRARAKAISDRERDEKQSATAAQRTVEKAARDYESAQGRVKAANRMAVESGKMVFEGVTQLARGVVLLSAANEDDAQKMLKTLATFEAVAQTTKGLINFVQGASKAYEAYQIAVKGAAAAQLALAAAEVISGRAAVVGAGTRVAAGAGVGAVAGGAGLSLGTRLLGIGIKAAPVAAFAAGFGGAAYLGHNEYRRLNPEKGTAPESWLARAGAGLGSLQYRAFRWGGARMSDTGMDRDYGGAVEAAERTARIRKVRTDIINARAKEATETAPIFAERAEQREAEDQAIATRFRGQLRKRWAVEDRGVTRTDEETGVIGARRGLEEIRLNLRGRGGWEQREREAGARVAAIEKTDPSQRNLNQYTEALANQIAAAKENIRLREAESEAVRSLADSEKTLARANMESARGAMEASEARAKTYRGQRQATWDEERTIKQRLGALLPGEAQQHVTNIAAFESGRALTPEQEMSVAEFGTSIHKERLKKRQEQRGGEIAPETMFAPLHERAESAGRMADQNERRADYFQNIMRVQQDLIVKIEANANDEERVIVAAIAKYNDALLPRVQEVVAREITAGRSLMERMIQQKFEQQRIMELGKATK